MDDRIRLAVTPEADIRVVASNPLASLDWQLDGLLSGLNLGVLDALDSIKAPTVHPLASLDWQPFLAIPNPAPVCPKRQRSVHRFGEPETPLDVCHHHDILGRVDISL